VSKDSWNAQKGCFEDAVYRGDMSSSSVGLDEMPTHGGMPDTPSINWKETTPQPSPVENQITSSSLQDFWRSTERLQSLTGLISKQLNVLSACARGQEQVCLAILRAQEAELALMSLNLASLISNVCSNREAQTGSAKPPSPSTSPTGSMPED
jgi:hypothetical protein